MIRLQESIARQEKMKKKLEDDGRAAWMNSREKKSSTPLSTIEQEKEDARRRVQETRDEELKKNTLQLKSGADSDNFNNLHDSNNNNNNSNNTNNAQLSSEQPPRYHQVPGTFIQRLPFKNMNEILVSTDEHDDDIGDDATEGITSAVGNNSFSSTRIYSEAMKRHRSQRSHVHRTWDAIAAESAHARRSRAIKRSFTTAQMTPAWNPQSLTTTRHTEINTNGRNIFAKFEVNPEHQQDSKNVNDDADDDDDDKGKQNDDEVDEEEARTRFASHALALSPFCSKILRYEMEHATVNSNSNINRSSNNNNNNQHKDDAFSSFSNSSSTFTNGNQQQHQRRRRYASAVDQEFPQQQYLEERARAKFMAEVVKRREMANRDDDGDAAAVDDEIVSKTQKIAADGKVIPSTIKNDNNGNIGPKKYKRKDSSSSDVNKIKTARRSGVRAGGDDIVGLLSPVGVMAKALGFQQHRPIDGLLDNDEDGQSELSLYTTDDDDDSDDDDDGGNSVAGFFEKHRRTHLDAGINPPTDELEDENVDDAGRKLWTFEAAPRKKGLHPSTFADELKILDDGDDDAAAVAAREVTRAKARVAKLFSSGEPQPPPFSSLSDDVNRSVDEETMEEYPSDSNSNDILANRKGKWMTIDPTSSRGNGAGKFGDGAFDEGDRSGRGSFANTATTSRATIPKRKNRARIADIVNGITLPDDWEDGYVQYVQRRGTVNDDHNTLCGGRDDDDDYASDAKNRNAAGWRRSRVDLRGLSGLARELAMKYWNTRLNFVEADSKNFRQQQLQQKSTLPVFVVAKKISDEAGGGGGGAGGAGNKNMILHQSVPAQVPKTQNYFGPNVAASPNDSSSFASTVSNHQLRNAVSNSQNNSPFARPSFWSKHRQHKQEPPVVAAVAPATAFSISSTNGYSSLQQIIDARKNAENRMTTRRPGGSLAAGSSSPSKMASTRFAPNLRSL